jgi:hypothetical protein
MSPLFGGSRQDTYPVPVRTRRPPLSRYSSPPLPKFVKYERPYSTLQRQNTEISKQIIPEKEYRGLSPNFHIHTSVSDLYISTMGLPILLEEICRPILGLYKSLTDI